MRPFRAWFAVCAGAAAVLLGGALLAAWTMTPDWIGARGGVDGIATRIRAWGPWGVAGSIGLMVIHSFFPFPAEIVALANGMVYGPLWGAVITWAGAMLGAASAFALVRRAGRPLLQRALAPAYWRRIDAFSLRCGAAALLTARLIPAIAFNLINYAAALSSVSWWTFLWTTGAGILPLTVLLAVAGDRMQPLTAWTWIGLAGLVALVWAASTLTATPRADRPPVQRREGA